MADSSALAGLLDRASDVFDLANDLGTLFRREFQALRNGVVTVSPKQRHAGAINTFVAAVLGMREETKNPSEGFAGVAHVLRRAANTAKLMATSPNWDPYESWPYLNQLAMDGYEAVKAARAAISQVDPWDFSEMPTAGTDSAKNPTSNLQGTGAQEAPASEDLVKEAEHLAMRGPAAKEGKEPPASVQSEAPPKSQAADDNQPQGESTTSGYLGGTELLDSLGIHPERRQAFNQRLSRERLKLGNCWIEATERRPNQPQYLYRPNADELRKLAQGYQSPQSA